MFIHPASWRGSGAHPRLVIYELRNSSWRKTNHEMLGIFKLGETVRAQLQVYFLILNRHSSGRPISQSILYIHCIHHFQNPHQNTNTKNIHELLQVSHSLDDQTTKAHGGEASQSKHRPAHTSSRLNCSTARGCCGRTACRRGGS